MRKYMLLGASMLLLAATACNREKEVLPAEGTVTLRFTAVVSDGSTRTAYQNDKTASWVAGDQISVYVTNGTDGQVVTFTADETLTFEGQAPAGYTTIVAGAYPADAAHTFDATGVKTLHLPSSYTLTEDDDPASVLPLAGTYADGVMTFSHPFGALKFTIDNVPATATRFRFTTFGHRINGSYAPDADLEDTVVDAEKSVDINFPAAEGTFAFYVPMPAGELYADSVIALYDEDGKLVFQKVAPAAITVTKNVIKRIAAVSSWTKNEEWQAAYLRDVYSTTNQKVGSYVEISGTTGPHDIYLSSKSYFDTHYGTVEDFFASSYISNKQAGGSKPKTKNAIYNYNRLSPGTYVAIIYGLDESYNFTGEYNYVEFEVPEFVTPEGWSLEYEPSFQLSSGDIYPAVHVKVPAGTSYATTYMKKETFQTKYGSDAVAAIWDFRKSTSTIRTSTDIHLYFSSLEETDYVYLIYGVHERTEEGADRTFTYEYCLLEFTYTKPSDEPTEAYQAWIGKWSVEDGTNTDTWTISANKNNASYNIVGLCGRASSYFTISGIYKLDGSILIKAQMDISTFNSKMSDGNTYEVSLGLFGRKEASGSFYTYSSTPYDILSLTLDATNPDAATLAPAGSTYLYYTFMASYYNAEGTKKWGNYGTRPASATMTRIIEDGVMMADGMEEEDFIMTDFPSETIEVIEAE